MIGRTLRHYRIVEKVGAGGMGEVYRARDEHLDRDVAVKVLPAGTLTDEHARKRFRKEAEALSRLSHPNIQTVYDFDTQEGVDFLVMEYIPGDTLSEKLASGSLREKEIAHLGGQLADGLAAAHSQDIIHRDLKPANLRVTPDGRLEILDFGIAKWLRPVSGTATTESFTETQAMAGTLPYMAPEQLKGEPVDARSDIYSSGVVLYEMATGQRPFQEKLSTALSDAILHHVPVTPRAVNTRVSPELERIILKCLEKDPDNRYQSAKELAVDLRRLTAPTAQPIARSPQAPAWGRTTRRVGAAAGLALVLLVAGYIVRERFWPQATPPAGKIRLAVLPFDNLSGDPEQEYFSDGMTEEMIAHLGRLQPERLGVIARTSAMHYKDTDKRVDEIGQELRVDYILEGSVRREAERVRITAQLIQVSDQTHLWAQNYERELAGVFAIQSDVAGRIARSLEVELLPARKSSLARSPTADPEAHEAYLKGRYYWNRRTEEGLKKGLQYFEEAIEKDPNYALAYSGLADSYTMLGDYGYLPAQEVALRAKTAAKKALELDDTLAEAHNSLAAIYSTYDWDWVAAEQEYRRAIELDPGYATAHHWYSFDLSARGRHEEAIGEVQRAREADPLSLVINEHLGETLYYARRYDESVEQYRKTLEMDSSFWLTHIGLARTHVQKRMYDEAIAELLTAIELSGGQPMAKGALGHAYAMAGKRAEALKLRDELETLSKRKHVPPAAMALIYVGLNETDEALRWLEEANKRRDPRLPRANVDPRFDSLRSDPRFQDLLRRLNFPD